MGIVSTVGFSKFPAQSGNLGKRVRVCFNYNTADTLLGTIVRHDIEEPGLLIFRLDDGRYVLATECQYQPFP